MNGGELPQGHFVRPGVVPPSSSGSLGEGASRMRRDLTHPLIPLIRHSLLFWMFWMFWMPAARRLPGPEWAIPLTELRGAYQHYSATVIHAATGVVPDSGRAMR